MNVQVEHVCLSVNAGSRDAADRLITALEASVTIGKVDPEDPEIFEVEVENVKSVREAVAVFAGIASTEGFRPTEVFLDDIGGIQE